LDILIVEKLGILYLVLFHLKRGVVMENTYHVNSKDDGGVIDFSVFLLEKGFFDFDIDKCRSDDKNVNYQY